MGRLSGKIAVVTGGASGIGAATVTMMAAEGAKVVIADLNEKGAHALADKIKANGGEATGIGFDQGNEASINEMVEKAVAAYGPFHILMNNAAALHLAAGGKDRSVLETSTELFRETFHVNVEGVFLCCKYAIPHMLKTKNASIISIGSASGNVGELFLSAYGPSKSAVIGFSRYVAVQYGKQGLRSNSISPGVILTDTARNAGYKGFVEEATIQDICLTRLGKPEDIAYMTTFLASDESAFITGQDFKVDGGYYMLPPQTGTLLRGEEAWQKSK